MHPILFSFFGKNIHMYGVMVALGFLAGILTWQWLARHEKRPLGFASDLGFWLMCSGIVGARIAHVIGEWPIYRAAPWEIIRIDQGGLTFYGGFLLACIALILFARHHRLPVWHMADFAIPGLAIGHAMGRIGCFLNGCCYGRLADSSWLGIAYPPICEPGALFPGRALYPVQLIEAIALLLIWVILVAAYSRRKKNGTVFALYLLLYPPIRFILEYIRGDDRQSWFLFDVAQYTSIGLFLAGILLFALLPAHRFSPAPKK